MDSNRSEEVKETPETEWTSLAEFLDKNPELGTKPTKIRSFSSLSEARSFVLGLSIRSKNKEDTKKE